MSYDIVICGGGLAGLTLARQIRQQQPDRSVVLIDRLDRPLSEATHKVGESSVELGAYYLRSIYLDRTINRQFRQAIAHFFSLTQRMQRLFIEWAALSPGRLTYEFLDYLGLEFLNKWRLRNLQSHKSESVLIADQHENMARFEELAQVLFLLAIEDVKPELLAHFQDPIWLNAWRVGLNPERWEREKLFQPTTPRRDLRPIYNQIRSNFFEKESEQG